MAFQEIHSSIDVRGGLWLQLHRWRIKIAEAEAIRAHEEEHVAAEVHAVLTARSVL
jgi:hypothetical protein